MVTNHEPQTTANQSLAWMKLLYGRCSRDDGHIVVVAENKRSSVAWIPCRHIEQASRIAVSKPGLYVKVNLMDGEAMECRLNEKRQDYPQASIVGNRDEVKTVVSFHYDVDAGKPGYHDRETVLDVLDRMPAVPSMIVNSDGDVGGFHAYWCLREPFRIETPADREYIGSLTLRWQKHLKKLLDGKLDSTANIDRVLRSVGSVRRNGNYVSLHTERPDALYSLRELSLPADDDEIKQQASRVVKQQLNEILGVCAESDQPITEYIKSANVTVAGLLHEAGYQWLRGDEWIRPNSASGARTLKLATKLDTPGINVFSGGETNFSCLKKDGSVGQFYSIEAVFVRLRHGGDWNAAARWCHEKIQAQLNKSVDLGGILCLTK
jgi:hypothetical protein